MEKTITIAGIALFLAALVGLLMASRAYANRDVRRNVEAVVTYSRQPQLEPTRDLDQEWLDERWRNHWRATDQAFDSSPLAAWLAVDEYELIARAEAELEAELLEAVERMITWTTETAERLLVGASA